MEVLTADADADGKRLDQWLAARAPGGLSRSRLKALIEQGAVTVDGKPVTEAKARMREGMSVCIVLPEPEDPLPAPEDIPLAVLFEDGDLIVIDKPPGLVVHPGAGNPTGTLVNALIAHCGDSLSGIGGVRRPGIVHRLDKDTSGVMVVAKNDAAHKALSAQFADHGRTGALERIYSALVWGAPVPSNGTISTWLGRAGADRTRQAVVPETRPDARHAITHYRTISRYGDADGSNWLASLVDCTLETGRTHQIRVHMAHVGHPLVGDNAYGQGFRTKANRLDEPARSAVIAFPRQALHARLLAFEHPANGEIMRFETPLPADMAELVAAFARC